MSEAPKTIYLYSKYPGEYYPHYLETRRKSSDIEYIRKGEYDELQTKYDNLDVDCHRFHVANFDLQARIKELEEILKNALRCGWHSMEGSIDGTFDDLTEQEIRQFRKDAKSALAKESEG
jgi:hypothetical protein